MPTKKTKQKTRANRAGSGSGRSFDLDRYLGRQRSQIERELARRAATPGGGRLGQAMRYALLGGGKRLRPILVLAACESVGGELARALPAACAIEMIHTYSLVHDDLPAMDDDDLRRGRPTTHKAYDEATAILAGDALLTEAFSLLGNGAGRGTSYQVRLALVGTLADAAGWRGMVGGQALDLEAEGRKIGEAELRRLHAAKTGALLAASVRLGGLAGGATAAKLRVLNRYGRAIGLAFQIVDDLLDVTSDTKTLGKRAGADAAHEKSTFPKLLGLERSRREADRLIAQAKRAARALGPRAQPLLALADYVVARTH